MRVPSHLLYTKTGTYVPTVKPSYPTKTCVNCQRVVPQAGTKCPVCGDKY